MFEKVLANCSQPFFIHLIEVEDHSEGCSAARVDALEGDDLVRHQLDMFAFALYSRHHEHRPAVSQQPFVGLEDIRKCDHPDHTGRIFELENSQATTLVAALLADRHLFEAGDQTTDSHVLGASGKFPGELGHAAVGVAVKLFVELRQRMASEVEAEYLSLPRQSFRLLRLTRLAQLVLEGFGWHIFKEKTLAELSLLPLAAGHVEQSLEVVENAFAGDVESVKAARLGEALQGLLIHRARRQ